MAGAAAQAQGDPVSDVVSTLPVYRWRLAPDGLATVRQLRAMGLRPGGQDVAAELQRPRRRGPLVA